jgi:restriction system protein
MPVPTYDKCMLPLLQYAADSKEHHIRETIEALAEYFQLSEEDRAIRLPSGKKFKFDDRVQWANTYLKKAGLLKSVRRGIFQITDRGYSVLDENLEFIDKNYLMRFDEFVEFQAPSSTNLDDTEEIEETEQTPQEILDSSFKNLQEQLAQDLLDAVLENSPTFFEQLVVDLLLAMGYGGFIDGAGQRVGGPGDGGVDGIINEDRLGLDVIYIQAKRWNPDAVVGRQVVDSFAGSMLREGVSKGILITTSRFSSDAISQVRDFKQQKIILIDGETIAKLMIEFDIGVTQEKVYVLKKIDNDFFNP